MGRAHDHAPTAGEGAMMSYQEGSNMKRWCGRVAALLVCAVAPLSAWAQNAIQSVAASQQGSADVVRIELSEPLAAVPAGFAVKTPPRIALDLPGVNNATGKSTVELNQGNVRSVAVAQSGDRTRVVLNLKQAANYRAELQGKALVIVVETPTAVAGAAASTEPVHFAEPQNRNPLAIRDIDFRQQGQSLVVEFLRSQLPEGLKRRLDVTDFGTPVQTVTTTQTGDRVRLTVEPRGLWEHSAYQSDNQFVLEVRPQKVDPQKLTQGPGFSGDKLSLNFQSIEVRALLQVIADFTNFNIVTSDTVSGSVTLRLKDVPWDQALDIILQAKGLGIRKAGNVLWIAPKEEIAAKERADLEARAAIQGLEPLRTQSFQLN